MHSRARAHARKNDSTYEMIAHATNAREREIFAEKSEKSASADRRDYSSLLL